MQAFNLELAIAGKPVVTANGINVVNIRIFKNDTTKLIVSILENRKIILNALDGNCVSDEREFDLFMKEVKTEKVFIVIDRNKQKYGLTQDKSFYHTSHAYMSYPDILDDCDLEPDKSKIYELEIEVDD